MKALQGLALSLSLGISAIAQIAPTEANLRSAVSTGGTIMFNADGVIPLTSPLIVTKDVTIDATGRSITLDGQNTTNLIELASGIHLTLTNITLANGRSLGANGDLFSRVGGDGYGGAIRNYGGSVTAVNCTFANNGAFGGQSFEGGSRPLTQAGKAYGGAIWQTNGFLTVSGGTFTNNAAMAGYGGGIQDALGGAIYVAAGNASLQGVSFSSNTARANGGNGGGPGGAGEGGAIFLDSAQGTANECRFIGNSAFATLKSIGSGGALFVQGSSFLNVDKCSFLNNQAVGGPIGALPSGFVGIPGYGGAVYVAASSTASVSASTFAQNNAFGGSGNPLSPAANGSGFGGAVYIDGNFQALDVTFADNAAVRGAPLQIFNGGFINGPASDGGAVFNNGVVGLTNVTIVHNTATTSALAANAGTTALKNSLLGENSSADIGGTFTDLGSNLSDFAGTAFTQSSSYVVDSIKVGPLGMYGGATATIPILAGSPAIDGADDSAAPATDQRGRARPFGAHADIGAFESSPPFTLIGKVTGYFTRSTAVTYNGSSIQPNATGDFQLTVPQGTASISYSGNNTVFRENPQVIDVNADIALHNTAFKLQALTYDPDFETPTFTFGGNAGETWEFFVSNDLANWTSVHTNTFSAAGVFSMPLTNYTNPVFMKGVKR